jgi:hypothetical protein
VHGALPPFPPPRVWCFTHTGRSPKLLQIFWQKNGNFYNSVIICSFVHFNELKGIYYIEQEEAKPGLMAAFEDCNKTTVLSVNNGTLNMAVFSLMSKALSNIFRLQLVHSSHYN